MAARHCDTARPFPESWFAIVAPQSVFRRRTTPTEEGLKQQEIKQQEHRSFGWSPEWCYKFEQFGGWRANIQLKAYPNHSWLDMFISDNKK